jgi:hypothetical protein
LADLATSVKYRAGLLADEMELEKTDVENKNS